MPPRSVTKSIRFRGDDDLVVFSDDESDSDNLSPVNNPPSLTPSPASESTWSTSSTPPNGEENGLAQHKEDDARSLEMIASLKSPWNVRTPRPEGYWDDFPATKETLEKRIILSSKEIGVIFVDRPLEVEFIRIGDIYRAIQKRLERPLTPDAPQYEALAAKGRCQVERSLRAREGHDGRPVDEGHLGDFMDLLADKCLLSDIVPYRGSAVWKIVFKGLRNEL